MNSWKYTDPSQSVVVRTTTDGWIESCLVSTLPIDTEVLEPDSYARDISGEIDALERQHMLPRPVRDSLLAIAEKEAAALGYTPAQLRVVNAGYRKVKELDEQIAALRNQM